MGVPLMMTRRAQGSASSALRSRMRGFLSLCPSSGGVEGEQGEWDEVLVVTAAGGGGAVQTASQPTACFAF